MQYLYEFEISSFDKGNGTYNNAVNKLIRALIFKTNNVKIFMSELEFNKLRKDLIDYGISLFNITRQENVIPEKVD